MARPEMPPGACARATDAAVDSNRTTTTRERAANGRIITCPHCPKTQQKKASIDRDGQLRPVFVELSFLSDR
jgi:hypothetical protein